jgi:hypothetical protein
MFTNMLALRWINFRDFGIKLNDCFIIDALRVLTKAVACDEITKLTATYIRY